MPSLWPIAARLHCLPGVWQGSVRGLRCIVLAPISETLPNPDPPPLVPPLSLQDPRIERIPCNHKGTYADDCICERVRQHKCYIVATCDRDLRRRIRKVGGQQRSWGLGWSVRTTQGG